MAKSSQSRGAAPRLAGPGRAVPHAKQIGSDALKPGASRRGAAPGGQPPTVGRTPKGPVNRYLLKGGDHAEVYTNDQGVNVSKVHSFKRGEDTVVESDLPLDELFANKFTKLGPAAAPARQQEAKTASHYNAAKQQIVEDYDPDATLGEVFDIPEEDLAEAQGDEDEEEVETDEDEDEDAAGEEEEEGQDYGDEVTDQFGTAEGTKLQVFKQGKVYHVLNDGERVSPKKGLVKKSEVTKAIKEAATAEDEGVEETTDEE